MSYPFNIVSERCQLTGLNGAALSAGTTLTLASDGEAALRAVTMENGRFKVTYEDLNPDDTAEECSHHPYLKVGSDWVRLSTAYGDWTFFCAPLGDPYDEMEVIEASPEVIEVAWRVNAHALNVPHLSNVGVTMRDPDGNAVYTSGGALKYHTVVKFTKLMRMERGQPGYFVGFHSSPTIGPSLKQLASGPGAAANNESDFAEREFGPGSGALYVFSSNTNTTPAHMPTFIAKAAWDTAEAAMGDIPNHAWWSGIDDPTYGSMANVNYAPTQPGTGTFPRQQLTGPWWVADIPNSSMVGGPSLVRFLAMQMPLESNCNGFSSASYDTFAHFMNAWPADDGRPMKFQVFYGGLSYTADSSNSYANEPTAALRSQLDSLASGIAWPR